MSLRLVGVAERRGDTLGQRVDLAAEAAYVADSDADAGDFGGCAVVAPQKPARGVETGTAGEWPGTV